MANLTFGGSRLRLGGYRVECNITYRCNAICFGCNKAVGLATFEDGDMTVEQLRRGVDMLIEQDIRIKRFTFCGGEPVLHRDLQEMIYEVARIPNLQLGRVLTNGLNSSQKLRDKIVMPKRFKWVVNPLDNPDDPLSGKNDPSKRANKRIHHPFWISPADIGLEAKFENCTSRGWCGFGLESTGFAACGKAAMLGKLLGIDPMMREGDIVEHINTPIDEICKHCQYGLPGKRAAKRICQRQRRGELPEISPTFEKAFAQHAEAPLVQLEQF